jgi:hypothetical protein
MSHFSVCDGRALTLAACPMRRIDHSRKPERKRAGPEYFRPGTPARHGGGGGDIPLEPCNVPVVDEKPLHVRW